MRAAFIFIAFVGAVGLSLSSAAEAHPKGFPMLVISDGSIRIDGVELRCAQDGYISLAAAERALGPPSNQYSWGAPIYVWRRAGIALQTGWRGAEKGRIFKFQVYFEPSYDRRIEMKSGLFQGHLQVNGIDIAPETAFQSIHAELKNKDFVLTKGGSVNFAKKGGIEIYQAETGGKIARVDAWCP